MDVICSGVSIGSSPTHLQIILIFFGYG